MERAVKIAVVGSPTRVADELRTLPSAPEVLELPSLYAKVEELQSFHPDVLFHHVGEDDPEEAGALRLLRSLLPGLALVLVGDVPREVTLTPLADRLGARVLLLPCTPARVAAVLEQALTGSDRPREEVFLDLARGIADEINNPLMYLSGHLQLLGQGLPPDDADRRDQLAAAMDGVARISATLDKVRMLSRAAAGPLPRAPARLSLLVRQAIERAASGEGGALPLELAPKAAELVVPGDEQLLTAALDELCRLAVELRDVGCRVELGLEPLSHGARLRLDLQGPGLQHWQLPRTFEPYYLNRVLRGTTLGLSLFLVQTVLHAHGGQALARRSPDGSLRLELLWPDS